MGSHRALLSGPMQGLADAAQHKVEKQCSFIKLLHYYIVPTLLNPLKILVLMTFNGCRFY